MMRLTAAGWARDHGATEILDADLQEIPATEDNFTFGPNKPKVKINRSPMSKRVTGVTLHAFANMRFTGDYKVALRLDKEEIFHLFKLTHKAEIENLKRGTAFLWPELVEEEEEDE